MQVVVAEEMVELVSSLPLLQHLLQHPIQLDKSYQDLFILEEVVVDGTMEVEDLEVVQPEIQSTLPRMLILDHQIRVEAEVVEEAMVDQVDRV